MKNWDLEERQLVTDFHAHFQQFVESTDNWKPAVTEQKRTLQNDYWYLSIII